MMMQYTNCVVNAHKVQILMTCPVRNKLRLQTFIISHLKAVKKSKLLIEF